MPATAIELPADLFYVWVPDDDAWEDERYGCLLCRDTDGRADLVRGYDPCDGIFERPGVIVESLWGIDVCEGEYAREIERDLLAQFEERRERMILRGEN